MGYKPLYIKSYVSAVLKVHGEKRAMGQEDPREAGGDEHLAECRDPCSLLHASVVSSFLLQSSSLLWKMSAHLVSK